MAFASDGDFLVAKRVEVDRLEALARELLEANPYSANATAEEEAEWRELAHASRQMRPLLEALERADAREPGFEAYRAGFDFRLTEAITTVGTLCSFLRLQPLRQRKRRASLGRGPRAQSANLSRRKSSETQGLPQTRSRRRLLRLRATARSLSFRRAKRLSEQRENAPANSRFPAFPTQ
jgi:hypothetical protein